MYRFFKGIMIAAASVLMLTGGIFTNQSMSYVQAAEYTAKELVFLDLCDTKALAEWDDGIAEFTEEQKAIIKSYMDSYIIAGVKDDYQKAELIFNWIASNIQYNYDNAGASPYAVFASKTAVCGGYSNLYKAMLNLADIPAVVLLGNTTYGAHAWNAVYADDRWFYADSTWGAGWFDVHETDFNLDHETTRMESAKIETPEGLILGYDRGVAVIGVSKEVRDVVVPDSAIGMEIVSVSYQLFAEQYEVERITIGKNIRLFDTQILGKTLEEIVVSDDNQNYCSVDGVLYSKDKSQLLYYPAQKVSESFILPKETVNFDEKQAFSNKYLIYINVEKDNPQYSSYDGALYNQDQTELLVVPAGKTEIVIPDTANIGYSAFANVDCTAITIYAKKGSPAYQFAEENNLKVVDITNGMPTPTEEVKPTETEAPKPTETEVPKPTETEVPKPTETEMPKPTETEMPKPTETPKVTEEPALTVTPEITEEPVKSVTDVFDDVYQDWYTGYIQFVFENNLMTGLKGTAHFAPDANITKAQVAQVLYNMEGQPATDDKKVFTDLKDVYEAEWYADAVAWAYKNNIVTGDLNSKQFAPNADVTREQLALMMYRYASYKKMDVSASSDLEGLKNAENVSNWADDGVRWAVGEGLISGAEIDGVKDLAPQGNATRAQVAAILQRFCKE